MNKDQQKQLLSKLGINPYDFNHEDMEPAEVSPEEKGAGMEKASDWYSEEENAEFDTITLIDCHNGLKNLMLFQNGIEDDPIQILVDKYFAVLGKTHLGQAEFSKDDLMLIKNPPQPPTSNLREWYLNDFIITIAFAYVPEGITNTVHVQEKRPKAIKRMLRFLKKDS